MQLREECQWAILAIAFLCSSPRFTTQSELSPADMDSGSFNLADQRTGEVVNDRL